jgi:hypothetical protein
MVSAFLTFGNINSEDSLSLAGHRVLRSTNAPRVTRLISLAIFLLYKLNAIFSALEYGYLSAKVAIGSKHVSVWRKFSYVD